MMCLRWERRRSASRSADRANRPHELGGHIRGALTNGATGQEIQEVLLQTMACCGAPAVRSPSASPRPSWPRRAANSSSTSNVGSRPALSSRHRAIAPLGRLWLVKASVRPCLNNEALWLCAMVKSVRLCLKETCRLPSDRPPAARISGIRSAGTMQSRHLAPLSRPSPHRNRPVA